MTFARVAFRAVIGSLISFHWRLMDGIDGVWCGVSIHYYYYYYLLCTLEHQSTFIIVIHMIVFKNDFIQ